MDSVGRIKFSGKREVVRTSIISDEEMILKSRVK